MVRDARCSLLYHLLFVKRVKVAVNLDTHHSFLHCPSKFGGETFMKLEYKVNLQDRDVVESMIINYMNFFVVVVQIYCV